MVALKTWKFSLAVLLKSARAKTDLERATKKNVYVLDTIYSGSHAPVPTSIELVRSKAKGEKRKIMRQRIWHYDLPDGTRATGMDRRMNGIRRSSARCTRWKSTETLATSLVTRTFAKSLARNQRKKEEEKERREWSFHSLLLTCTVVELTLTRSHLLLFMIFSCLPAAKAHTVANTWGE